jgi:hypothetical protein
LFGLSTMMSPNSPLGCLISLINRQCACNYAPSAFLSC